MGQTRNLSLDRLLDRRKHIRHPLRTAAIVIGTGSRRQPQALYWVSDLSVGGALLSGGPTLKVGAALSILLHLPWFRPITLRAMVVRACFPPEAKPSFGVAFSEMTESVEASLTQAIAAGDDAQGVSDGPTVLRE